MQTVKLLHNPNAGDEEHEKEELIAQIHHAGFNCEYASVKQWSWNNLKDNIDFIVIAGGDGTVRKVIKKLLNRKALDKIFPIALLPMGTANNISKTLGIKGDTKEIIQSWQKGVQKKYDVGRISNVKKASFFLESFGYGLLPFLMKEMEPINKTSDDPPEKMIQKALEMLEKIGLSYPAKDCKLFIDGKNYSGRYLLAEIMNIRSIGPNLFLSPGSDPGDGLFEVVLVEEDEREKFIAYIRSKMQGKEEDFDFEHLKARNIIISWDGKDAHADDEVLKIENKTEVVIEIKPGLLDFIISK
ncbi:MAG: diacylglycerol/lipid kinase family protein [Ilyomonas sp.]